MVLGNWLQEASLKEPCGLSVATRKVLKSLHFG